MDNDLINKPDSDQDTGLGELNPGQAHHDSVAGGLSKAEQGNFKDLAGGIDKTADPSDENKAIAKASALGAAGLGAAEAAGLHFNPIDATAAGKIKKGLDIFFGSRRRKQASAAGGITGIIIGGVFLGFTVASGPLELIHLSEVLAKNFTHSSNTSSVRGRGLFRFARSGAVGETRVGLLGSKQYAKTVQSLKDIGIEFSTNKFSGAVDTVKLDPKALADKIPELKGLSPEEQVGQLSKTFGIDASKFSVAGDGSINLQADGDIKLVRSFTKDSTALISDSKLLTALRARTLAKFFDAPSLWHPLKATKAKLNIKLGKVAALKEEEKTRVTEQKPSIPPEGEQAVADIKGRFSGANAIAGAALLFTAVVCQIRDSANDIVVVNNAAVVAPAAAQAADAIALGAQIKDGQDVSSQDVEAALAGHTDSNGKTIWQSAELQETAQPGTATASSADQIPASYGQAFMPSTTAATIKNTAGGGFIGGVACSPLGKLTQAVAGTVLLLAAVPTDGVSAAALFALKAGVTVVGTVGAFYLIHDVILNAATDAVVPKLLSGPVGGSLLAYGARSAAAITGMSSGEVALSPTESQAIDQQQAMQDKKQFESRPLVARLFDTSDYRSLVSRAIDSNSGNAMDNVRNVALSIFNLGGLAKNLLGAIIPAVHADAQPFKWLTPQYGIPASVLNNSAYADPYTNADSVAKNILDVPTQNAAYTDRANKCFGVTINRDSDNMWQVLPDHSVNPASEAYISGNCNDLSDTNWQRMMLFIFDSRTMDAAACVDANDTTSCQNTGMGNSSSNTLAPTGSVGSAGGLTFPLKTTKDVIEHNTGTSSTWCYTQLTNCHHDYNAADIFAPTGTIVVAARSGKVIFTKDATSEGSILAILADTGQVNYYAHMGTGTLRVASGEHVAAGQEIGAVGTNVDANNTDHHLHIDELPSPYTTRMACASAGCSNFPFINIQEELVPAFNALP